MSSSFRVILEIGKKRRVVAGATDWPGPDRWGTAEDDAVDTLLSYVPRYAGVAERPSFARASVTNALPLSPIDPWRQALGRCDAGVSDGQLDGPLQGRVWARG